MRTERSADELSKLYSEGLAESVDFAVDLPSLDLQRDDNGDNCRNQRDQSGEQGLPVIDEIDEGCVVPRHGDVVP